MKRASQPVGIVVAFGDGGRSFEQVAGLPLALRALLELARAGVTRLELLTDEPGRGRSVLSDRRLAVPVAVRGATSLAALAEVLAGEGDEHAVVVPAVAVAQREVYAALVAHAREGREVRAVVATGLGPFVLGAETARALASAPEVYEALAPLEEGWVVRADDAASERRIVDELFEGCRKPVDGIVSRHLNRHISIFVSKRLVDTSLSPNVITLATAVLGAVAAAVTAQASYGAMVAGAALLQANSVLDGVDGELARVRFQHSKLGQWLDTVCDDLANTSFYAGVTYAAFQLPTLPSWLPYTGVAAVSGSLVTMALYYAELIRLGSGDFYALDVGQHEARAGWWAALNQAARYVTKRDFFVFAFLVAALLGLLPWVLPIAAAGTVATVVTGLRITLKRLGKGPRAA